MLLMLGFMSTCVMTKCNFSWDVLDKKKQTDACDQERSLTPVDILSTRILIYYPIVVRANYGELQDASLNANEDGITINFQSDGLIEAKAIDFWEQNRFEGRHCVAEKMEFHLPSVHTFDGELRDVELMIYHGGEDESKVIASIFFDQREGGNEFSEFIDATNIGKVFIKDPGPL